MLIKKARSYGHEVANYLSCFIQLLHPDDLCQRDEGARKMLTYRQTSEGKKYIEDCRRRINHMICVMMPPFVRFLEQSHCRAHIPYRSGVMKSCSPCNVSEEFKHLFDGTNWTRTCSFCLEKI